MINDMMELASHMNASGSEHNLIDAIRNLNPGSKLLPDGSICIFPNSVSKQAPTIMISTPVDVVGFLALSKENNIITLQTTSKIDTELCDPYELTDERGVVHKASLDKNKNLMLNDEKISIGDVFRLKHNYSTDDKHIIGADCALYALITLLVDLTHEDFEKNVVLHFAVQGKTNAKSELCAAQRIQPELCILLGSKNLKNNSIMLKDGKHVSSRKALDDIGVICEDDFVYSVSDEQITKAADLTANGYRALSIALAASNIGTKDETVEFSKIQGLNRFLVKLINQLELS